MRTVIHLSDLHFGRVDAAMLEPLLHCIHEAKPDLIVISGDLTQRARSSEFIEARHFIDQLGFPKLVVPGNHDIPLHNLFARFARSLTKYRRHIERDLAPFFCDGEIAVAGVNTARSLTTKYGRISEAQMAELAERFRQQPKGVTRIVVTHHPFDLPDGYEDRRQLVGRAEMAMAVLATSEVDLVLSGHLHLNHTAFTATRYRIAGYSALLVQAGTAISTRGRGEANSFNLLQITLRAITVKRMDWDSTAGKFDCAVKLLFEKSEAGWRRPIELPVDASAPPA
jgi:3',5'-cyclic AMP phosphodiesterase CpdA